MISDRFYQALSKCPFLQRQFKRLLTRLPHRQRQVRHFGQRLVIDPSELAGFWLYYEREYDDFAFRFLESRLPQYERAVDIGAHYGIYSVYLGARMKRVDAFEPVPSIVARLRRNVALNRLSSVTVHETCLSSRSGIISFLLPSKSNEGLGRIAVAGESAVSRPSCSLDDFFDQEIRQSCLIKMDVEGGEWLILQGAQRVLDRPSVPVALLIEVHPQDIVKYGGTMSEFKKQLEVFGFDVQGLTPEGLVPLTESRFIRFWWAVSR